MILSYSIENFKSIGKEVKINFRARKYKETKLAPIRVGNEEVLPLIGLYGPNGGGKSAIILSLAYLYKIINHSNAFYDENAKRLLKDISALKNFDDKENDMVWKIEVLSKKTKCLLLWNKIK